MATKPIDAQIDLLAAELDLAKTENAEQPQHFQEPVGDEPSILEDPMPSPVDQEEVEVASLGSQIIKAYKTPLAPTTKPEAPRKAVPKNPDPDEITSDPAKGVEGHELPAVEIENMTPDEVAQYKQNLADIRSGEVARTEGAPADIGGGRLDPSKLLSDQDFADHIQAITEVAKRDLKSIKVDDLYEQARQRGFKDKDLEALVDPNRGAMTAEEAAVFVLESMRSSDVTHAVAQEVRQAAKEGPIPLDLQVRYERALAYELAVKKGLQKKKTNWGQTGAVLNGTADPRTNTTEHLRQILLVRGGESRLRMLAYLEDKTRLKPKQREWFLKLTAGGSRAKNMLYYHYYSAMLSSPDTWQRVIGGNGLLTIARAAERPIAAAYGNVRVYGSKLLGKDVPDAIPFREILMDVAVFPRAFADMIVGGSRAAWHNKSFYGAPKTDHESMVMNPFHFGIKEGDSLATKAGKSAVNLYGLSISAAPRAMFALDDAAKSFNMSIELKGLAVREAERVRRAAYDRKVADGVNPEIAAKEADEASQEAFETFIQYPSDEMWDEATRLAEDVTLTARLSGGWEKLEGALNAVPGSRVFIPFIRAPVHGFVKAAEFDPILGPIVSQEFRRDLFMVSRDSMGRLTKDGKPLDPNRGIKHDIAMARLGLGGMFGGWVTSHVVDTKEFTETANTADWGITGGMPYSREERSVRIGRGEQPFSIWRKRSQFSDEELEQIKDMPGVVITKDRVYKSYVGYEPLSAILAMTATSAEYMSVNTEDAEFNDKLAFAVSAFIGDKLDKTAAYGEGAAKYAAELPMLKVFGDFMNSVQFREEDQSIPGAIAGEAGRTVTNFFMLATPMGWNSAGVSYADRLFDPEKKVTRGLDVADVDYADLPGALRTVMDEIAEHRANNPGVKWFFDDNQTYPRYNLITGRTLAEQGDFVDRALAANTTIENADPAFQALLDTQVGMPTMPKKIAGMMMGRPGEGMNERSPEKIHLNDEQLSAWMRSYSNMPIVDANGSELYDGDNVGQALRGLYADDDWVQKLNADTRTAEGLKAKKEARTRVQDILSSARNSADFYVLNLYPQLQAKIEAKRRKNAKKEQDYMQRIQAERQMKRQESLQ